jgi:hypothetical protein
VGLDDGGDPFHGGSLGVSSVAFYVLSAGMVSRFKEDDPLETGNLPVETQ